MNDLVPANLNSLLGTSEYLRLTILQVNKDLSSFTTIRLNESELNINKIQAELISIINSLERTENSSLNGFIYRVDLNEKTYHEYLNSRDKPFLVNEILKREVLKVYLKTQLSNK